MRRWRRCEKARPAVVLALAILARAEIIDRIAVTVGDQVITETEIVLELRLTAFLNGDPVDLSPVSRRAAAERLIEQKLVRREMELGRYPQTPAENIGGMVAEFRRQRFGSAERYQKALGDHGITERDLQAHLLWQRTFLRFLGVRFRSGVQVSEDDVRAYYEKSGERNRAPLEAMRDEIEQTLTDQRVDRALDRWLQRTRGNTRIEFRDQALGARK